MPFDKPQELADDSSGTCEDQGTSRRGTQGRYMWQLSWRLDEAEAQRLALPGDSHCAQLKARARASVCVCVCV